MTTFIELCRKVARDSGTASGIVPTSVNGQSGRPSLIIYSTGDAWREIQTMHDTWLWMRKDFSGQTTVNTSKYSAASFGIARWAGWVGDPGAVSTYKLATGRTDEHWLPCLPRAEFEQLYDRGEPRTGPPQHWTVDEIGQFWVGPVPDDIYMIRGKYRAGPQELVNDGDVPEMPVQFHDLIAHRGVILLSERDEGQFQTLTATRRFNELLGSLMRSQLPMARVARALA